MLRTIVAASLCVCLGCGSDKARDDDDGSGASSGSSGSSASSASGSTGSGSSEAHALCVDRINEHRASVGLPPYVRWSDSEACADQQAASDAATGQAHGAFGQCGELAQNECPGWSGPPEAMIAGCLELMWGEGPGGGHYDNMANSGYTEAACGFHVLPSGEVWSVQNFR